MILEMPSIPLTDVLAGKFSFIRSDGTEVHAEFYVRCEPRPNLDDPEFSNIMVRRNDAYNLQYAQMFGQLSDSGCTNIHYEEVKPDPFF